MILRRAIDLDIEKKITTAFIVSTSFCKKTFSVYKKEYFEIDYAKTVIEWVLAYFRTYNVAPGVHIQDIYDVEKETLDESEADTISVFLNKISDEYINANVENLLNVDYLVDQAKKYFRKRALAILFEKGNKKVSIGMIEDAEKLLLEYKAVAKNTSGRFDPFDVLNIRNYDVENLSNRLFKLPGALGELIGWLERSWLVAVMACEKKGKSWYLEELIFSALVNRLKILWVSLEMSKAQLEKRIYQKLTGLGSVEEDGFYPVFDCKRNQDGTCFSRKRINDVKLFKDDGCLPEERKKRSMYKVCTVCRGNSKRYIPAYWYQYERVKKLKSKVVEKKAKHFISMYGGNLRVKAFPRFSANMDDIINELNDLEFSENFLVDVLVIDYLEITAGSDSGGRRGEREKIDENWKNAAKIAGMRNCLVITADQADALARNQRSLTESNWSESKQKDAHLDVRIGLNQTNDEKKAKVARVNVLMHRHNYFHPKKECLILQDLSRGQALLDSEFWNESFEKDK